ncbi:glycoside hydrolase family 9 protein [Devosia faecipullorum]|uniref:glycoside hydrolase family 9 protein n=1 Tax=Devosia faecipullorum TaxID=2755039 RepID=UPI00187B3C60|nr:glycoside hydrolase family 9 protein [Devosia faecipullorum]MBE7732890.1 glycoside hydrolase family 9 protein [Devosia faecipullorum]
MRALMIGLLQAALFWFGAPGHAQGQVVRVVEIALAAPDIVHVILEDPPFIRGEIIGLEAPRPERNGAWIDFAAGRGMVIGPQRDHLRLADKPPSIYLDRKTIDDASAYPPIGDREVLAVYRKSMPYDAGIFPSSHGDTRSGASFRHDLYLKLDGSLPAGSYSISWPQGLLPDAAFEVDEKRIRASAIHLTQNGHRRGDLGKLGFLSLWLPGGPDQGAIDFRTYGLDRFEIVDEHGETVFSGVITLRSAPDSEEPGNGLANLLLDYRDGAAEPVALTGISGTDVSMAGPHDFAPGQRIALERLGGDQDASAIFADVMAANATGMSLGNLSAPLPPSFAPGAIATPAHRANRSGTFVFALDYANWTPERDGRYHLLIRGLGVSDPLVIADRVWAEAARTTLGGLYNHRSGVELDGRFGYSRTEAFRPGADLTIFETRLPFSWSNMSTNGFVPFSAAAAPDWLTEIPVPQTYWGGYMDAGDWDRRTQHLDVTRLMLAVHETTPAGRELNDTGLPKSAEALRNPLYADLNSLPDILHEALWGLDFFRRLQSADGSVRGGIESAEHPLRGEPSFLEHQTVFAYAPDHLSSYQYAASAASMARILKELDHDQWANLYADSAVDAWAAGERGFADPDTYYADAIAIGTRTGLFDDISWPLRRDALADETAPYRSAAAAALFRLTGEPSFAALFEAGWRADPGIFTQKGDAAWDYLQAEGGDAKIRAEITARILAEATLVVEAQEHFAYPSLKHPDAPAGWGQGGAPGYHELQTLIRAHQISADPAILRALEHGYHSMLGANQLGRSLVTGLGLRSVNNPLHEDRLAMGVAPPPGIVIYGWAGQAETAYGWIFGPPWSPLPESGTDEHAADRRIDPPRFALPYFEYLVEHPALIMQQEYTVHQSIATMAALALYIHGR